MSTSPRIALITGAGRGIGQAIAQALAREGYDIAGVARTAPEIEAAAEAVRKLGRAALPIAADLTDLDRIGDIVDPVLDAFGRIDLLVNNAGYACFKPFLEYTRDEWQRTLALNLTVPFLLIQHVAPIMARQGGGRIINISSVAGLKPITNQSAYCASKYGLNGLSKVLAMELRAHNVRVHTVCPGGVDTRLAQDSMPERDRTGWMQPEDIADACVYLSRLSDRAVVDELVIRRTGSVPLGG